MTDRQTLLDMLAQLSEEIIDGEQHLGHLKRIGKNVRDRDEVQSEVSFLRREHRTILLRGYFLVTGSVVPDAEEPAPLRAVRDRLRKRVEGESGGLGEKDRVGD